MSDMFSGWTGWVMVIGISTPVWLPFLVVIVSAYIDWVTSLAAEWADE